MSAIVNQAVPPPKAAAVLVWLLAVVPATVTAQAGAGPPDPGVPKFELGSYVGIARHSPAGTHLGVSPDRNHVFVGVDLTANLVRRERWAFGYAPELVPLLVISNNPRYRTISIPGGGRFTFEDGRGPVAGFGVSPLGLRAQMRLSSRWWPYVGGAAGVVWFTRAVPVTDSRAFNYTFEFGAGVRWRVRDRESLRIGYKFHHLSNAYSAPQNPGIDAAVFLVGYERAMGSRW
jgi:hypothetical protein